MLLIITIIVFPLLFVCFSGNSLAEATSFDFTTINTLTTLGDSHLYNTTVRLTKDLTVPNTGAGCVFHSEPVRFLRDTCPDQVSFVSYFSFLIESYNPDSIGGGLAFVISPDGQSVGDAGGYLGIPSGSVAFEFDTEMDLQFKDINANHVGVDLHSVVSSHAVDLNTIDIDLRSGCLVRSWIEYTGSTNELNVYVSYHRTKPRSPVLSITMNLGEYVNEFMYVGFCASTHGSTETHTVDSWNFTSSFDDSVVTGNNSRSTSPPHPSPPRTHTVKPLPPSVANLEKETRKQRKTLACVLKATGIVAATIFITGSVGYSLVRCSNGFRDIFCMYCNKFTYIK